MFLLSFTSAQETKVVLITIAIFTFLISSGNIGVGIDVQLYESLNIVFLFYLKMSKKLTDFLQNYLTKKSFFKDKKALQQNYTPRNVP